MTITKLAHKKKFHFVFYKKKFLQDLLLVFCCWQVGYSQLMCGQILLEQHLHSGPNKRHPGIQKREKKYIYI